MKYFINGEETTRMLAFTKLLAEWNLQGGDGEELHAIWERAHGETEDVPDADSPDSEYARELLNNAASEVELVP